jgi:hypothetical protein
MAGKAGRYSWISRLSRMIRDRSDNKMSGLLSRIIGKIRVLMFTRVISNEASTN